MESLKADRRNAVGLEDSYLKPDINIKVLKAVFSEIAAAAAASASQLCFAVIGGAEMQLPKRHTPHAVTSLSGDNLSRQL